MNRVVLHIDMNSYFASVEQQLNPFLRGKPIAIGGSVGTRSVCIAASVEAKRYGVKVGMNHIEAREACPHIQFIHGNPALYAELTQKFINISRKYSPQIDVYSIDELFMELTDWIKTEQQAIEVAKELKQRLKQEVGDYLRCSVGIAPNRMLAKVCSNMKKPDGLIVLRKEDVSYVLKWIDLTDIPGIGPRLKRRFFDMGITTIDQLGKAPVEVLQREFGPNYGITLSNMGKGIDLTEIGYIDEVVQAKSIGHTYTLKKNTKSKDELYGYLLKLAEKVGRRLRKDDYQARYVWVYLRWADMTGRTNAKTLKQYIYDGYDVYKIGRELVRDWYLPQPVRLVGIGTSLLIYNSKQSSLLEEEQKKERLVAAQDAINDRFGSFSIQRARSLQTSLVRKVGGFKEPHQFH